MGRKHIYLHKDGLQPMLGGYIYIYIFDISLAKGICFFNLFIPCKVILTYKKIIRLRCKHTKKSIFFVDG
jgi:hypothetical protein